MIEPSAIPGRPRALVPVLLVGCWATLFLGPVTLLIVPALLVGLGVTLRSKAWGALCVLLVGNPLGVHFLGGVASYLGGAPTLRFRGLPSIESFNLDRASRCFRSGGGCLVSGNEWVTVSSHNFALRLMARWFGPPRRSYDGPYPTEEEAVAITANAPATPELEFLEGNVRVNGETISLGAALTGKLVERLAFLPLQPPEENEFGNRVQAALHQERCLVLRLSEGFAPPDGNEGVDREFLLFFDRETLRPFAYFKRKGTGGPRFPPVTYLPEQDR